MISGGMAQYRMTYQISPIFLTGGLAGDSPVPIINYTESDTSNLGIDDYFATFVPLPGSTIIDNQVGMYPFANQAVAANAIIAQPLTISMMMICPAKSDGGYNQKISTMQALQSTLDQHNKSGGTYTVNTPDYVYTSCLMTSMKDISTAETKQLQNTWRMDFVRPLLTLEQAQEAQNNLLSKISSGASVGDNPAWSGTSPPATQSSISAPTVSSTANGASGGGFAPSTTAPYSAIGGSSSSSWGPSAPYWPSP